jgi:anti-sigma regulatory factor (Ser/Thr protein kinase)
MVHAVGDDGLQLVAELVVPAELEMLAVCRMVLAGVAAGLPISDDAMEDLKLLLSEVCAAAIERSREADGSVDVAFRTSEREIEITVADHGRTVVAQESTTLALPVLRELCSRIEVAARPRGEGTVLRFARSLPA